MATPKIDFECATINCMKNIYYSWRSSREGLNSHILTLDKKILNLATQSTSLIRLNYPKSKIRLVTDTDGKEFFSSYQIFDDIIVSLDALPVEYKEVWSLGKIKAYDLICDYNEPFVHLDFDVFISAPFPKKVLESELFVQGQDYCGSEPYDDPYFSSKFLNLVENKPYFIGERYSFSSMYNMAIFGGTNISLIKEYASETLKMILDPKNKSYFSMSYRDLSISSHYKACVAEQYSLGSFLAFNKISPKRLLPDGFCGHCRLDESLEQYNYVHLPAGLKDLSEDYYSKCLNKIYKIKTLPKTDTGNFFKLHDNIWPPKSLKRK